MKSYLDEYSMRQASIFELRNLARDYGVNSPTTYKKEQLIEKILKIASGEEKPQMPKSRQGRPPKKMHAYTESTSTNFLKGISGEDCQNIKENYFSKKDFDSTQFDNTWVLACPNTYEFKLDQDETSFCFEEREGYLQIMQDGSGFIFQKGRCANADTAIYVAKKTVADYSLKNSDLINCVCKKVISNETRYLTEIKKINGILLADYKKENRLNFDNLQIVNNSNNNYLIGTSQKESVLNNIKQGARNIIKCKKLNGYVNILKNINAQNKGCSVINLCLEVLPEQEGLFKLEPNTEHFYTIFGDSEKQNNTTISLAVERIKRIAEQNKSVIFVVSEIGKLIKFQNFSLGNEAYDVKYKSLNNVYSVLNLAREFENNNVTVVCLFKDFVFSENLYKIEEEFENYNCNILNLN